MARAGNVPFLDLRALHDPLRDELRQVVCRVVDSGRYVLGEELERFESEFAELCGVRHCVGVGSGLDALRLALEAAGIGPGDRVVVPAQTFVATWLAVVATGAEPDPVDVDASTGNLDPDLVATAIGPSTRAMVPVHLFGQLAAMDEIVSLAEERGVAVIEDAAQAHGAHADGHAAGSFGASAAFSFYPAKNLGALGDAGAVTTDDDAIAQAVRRNRNYGGIFKYEHGVAGSNSRLDEIQAAVLRVKLGRLKAWNARRREIAQRYIEGLGDTGLALPGERGAGRHAWHLFVVRHPERDRLRAGLMTRGIETLVHYPQPPHLTGAFAGRWSSGSFPVAERWAREALSLPLCPSMTDEHVEATIEAVRAEASSLTRAAA